MARSEACGGKAEPRFLARNRRNCFEYCVPNMLRMTVYFTNTGIVYSSNTVVSEDKVWAIQGLLQIISSELKGSGGIVDGNYVGVREKRELQERQ